MKYCVDCATELGPAPDRTCPSCARQHWLNPRCCAGALVVHDGRLLLVRRSLQPWAGYWDIPGGYCENGEHPEQTAVRETREESGMSATVDGFFGIWVDPPESAGGQANICVYYTAVLETEPDPVFTPTAETDAVGWFAPGELPREIAFPGHIPAVLSQWAAATEGGRHG